MITVFDIYDALQQKLTTIGLPIYKEVKKTSETGNCIVLNSVPIIKNNYNSVNDLIPILYLKKLETQFDKLSAQRLSPLISSAITDFIKSSSFVTVTERLEPYTLILDDSYTTTLFTFRIITH